MTETTIIYICQGITIIAGTISIALNLIIIIKRHIEQKGLRLWKKKH